MNHVAQLQKQLKFIATSCEEFDAGNKDEAIRIAVSIRVLMHDTNQSVSLLRHLGAKNIRVLSTSSRIPRTATFYYTLCDVRISPKNLKACYIPKLDRARARNIVRLDDWWNAETIFLFGQPVPKRIRRRALVLAAANKDGGAHVDRDYETDYETILKGMEWGMTVNPAGQPKANIKVEFEDAHLAALRQMGYELLNSPELRKLAEKG